jgi:hypothetical protein
LLISLHLHLVLFFLVLCSRPTALQDRTRDSDEDDLHDRDYDVAALANNLSQAFRYKIYGNEDNEEVHQWLLFLKAFIPFFLPFFLTYHLYYRTYGPNLYHSQKQEGVGSQ